MVFHLDKCLGCHTCSVACKKYLDRPQGRGIHVVEQRRNQARHRLPVEVEDQSIYKGGWEQVGGALTLKGAGKQKGLLNIFHNPHMPVIDDYYEPFTYKYLDLIEAPAGDDQPTARRFP